MPDPDGIYFIDPSGRISYYRFATGLTVPVVPQPRDSNPYNPGPALSPDGRWLLYGQMDRFGADIMLVENFQ